MQIITLLKRSHSSWRSNRLLETAARRESSWGGAVGRKWEINSVSGSATVRHIFFAYFSSDQTSRVSSCWFLYKTIKDISLLTIWPSESIWTDLKKLIGSIDQSTGRRDFCFFCTSAFVSLVSWLGGVVGWAVYRALEHSNLNACRQGWIDRSPGGGWMMKSMAGYHRLLFSGRILHTLYPLFVCFLF